MRWCGLCADLRRPITVRGQMSMDSSTPTRISVYRQDDSRLDRGDTFLVMIDDVVAGGITAGARETYKVAAGAHSVRMRYGALGSNTVSVAPVTGQEVELLCSSQRWPMRLVIVLFRWDRYLRLRQLASGDTLVTARARVRPRRIARKVVPGLAGAVVPLPARNGHYNTVGSVPQHSTRSTASGPAERRHPTWQ
jgi:hypothetical protein